MPTVINSAAVAFVVPVAAILGLAVGSFLNVVIYRLPRGESLSTPGSHCPRCDAPIRARHNVPVLGWLVLRGRCADCGAPISPRYPLIEALTGVLFAAVAWRLNALNLLAAVPAYLWFVGVGVALTMIDLDLRRLPNRLVLPSYPVIAALLVIASAALGDWWPLARAAIGAVALFGFYLLLVLVYPAGMGWGDVKLAGVLGMVLAWLSWAALLVGAFAGFLFGAIVGVAVIALGRGGRKTALPFGPFMILGALFAIFAAATIAAHYPSV
jgi:leader peptidase (prepilin peptidase)/N-methyltransferase